MKKILFAVLFALLAIPSAEAKRRESAEEIEQIEEAVNVSVDMHCAAMRAVRPGTNEAEIVSVVQAEAAKHNFNLKTILI